MFNSIVALFFVACFVLVTTEHLPPMKGMQLLSITCDTDEKLALVLQFQTDKDFDFITITRQPYDNVEVAITANKIDEFKNLLESHDIEYKVQIEDVQKLVEKEKRQARRRRRSPIKSKLPYSFDHFPRHRLINSYMRKIAEIHEDAALISIGSSYEGRQMYGVKIANNDKNETKPAILIDAGIHAREWISLTTALFAIRQLLNESNKHLYKNVDWYIIPSMNPDGYEFSHEEYRLWRKTRSEMLYSSCVGVDGNRNYDYKWEVSREGRYSDNPCENIYRGEKAFSEIETRNMRDFVSSANGTIKLYVNLHSTSQNNKWILVPWAHTKQLPNNYSTLVDLAEKASSAIFAHQGSNYTVGAASEIYYVVGGTSIDWFLGTENSNFSYCIELPSRDFETSEDKIEEIGLEIFEALKIFGKHIEDNFVAK